MKSNLSVETQKGQGQARSLSDEEFKSMRDALDEVGSTHNRDIWRRRTYSDRTRFCLWADQFSDGRKHDTNSRTAMPFDGASDGRIRLADMIINMQVAVCKAACKRGNLTIQGTNGGSERAADDIRVLARQTLNNRIGHEWRMEMERFFNWSLGDSPAVALMHITWEKETRVRMREFGVMELIEYLVAQGVPFDEETAANLESLIKDEDRADELISVILQQFPELKASSLHKALKKLRENGSTEFPEPYVHRNDAAIEAQRMWQDVFVPVQTRSPRKCRYIFKRSWYSLADLEAKVKSGEWNRAFVEELKKHKGKSKMPEQVDAGYGVSEQTNRWNQQPKYEHLYEVWHAYTRSSNDDGYIGIYTLDFSSYVDQPAGDVRLLDYPHGDFPFVWHVREVVSNNLLDARGISELVITDQNFLKSLLDLTSDHAQISSLPPYLTDGRMTERDVRWVSLGQIKKRKTDLFEPVKIPDMPRSNLESQARIMERVSQYFGLPFAEVNQMLLNLTTQDMVDDALDAVKEIVKQILQNTIKFKSADELRAMAGNPNMDVEALRNNLHLLDDMTISFDPQVFDIAYLETMAKIMRDFIMAMDREQTIKANELVDFFVRALLPGLGDKFLRPVEEASMAEANEEKINYALIKAGVEPEMAEDGQNFALRLQTLQQIVEANPESVAEMSDVSKQILAARVEHLSNQVQQADNADTGRRMGQTALQ